MPEDIEHKHRPQRESSLELGSPHVVLSHVVNPDMTRRVA